MADFFQQLLLLSIPDLARTLLNSITIAIAVFSVFLLLLILSRRQTQKRKLDHKTWLKLKADHYQRFHELSVDFEKLASDFDYLTHKARQKTPDCLESSLLIQLKDKQEELNHIVETLQHAKYPVDKELYSVGYFSPNRYVANIEKTIKTSREYLNNHYRLEDAID